MDKPKSVAIIGAGLAGLSVANQLLNNKHTTKPSVIIFDARNSVKDSSASYVGAGLVHPFVGMYPKKTPLYEEAVKATFDQIEPLENKSFLRQSDILKITVSKRQEKHFEKLAKNYPDDLVVVKQNQKQFLASQNSEKSFLIKNGIQLNFPQYLDQLKIAATKLGAQFREELIDPFEIQQSIVIHAGGALGYQAVKQHLSVPLRMTKGHLARLKMPLNTKTPILGKGYIALTDEKDVFQVGSTYYEKEKMEHDCDIEQAKQQIHKQLSVFLPQDITDHTRMLSMTAGYRLSSPDHLPIIGEFKKNHYVISAFGSRGGIYHALMARMIANQILERKKEPNYDRFSYHRFSTLRLP